MNPLLLASTLLLVLAPQDGQKPKRRPPRDADKPKEKYVPAVPLPDGYVTFVRVPEEGREPRLATRGEHAPALLFARGEEGATDLYLTRTTDDGATFAPAVRVNPTPGGVASFEGRHSGSLHLGPDGRAHVTWIAAGARPAVMYTHETEAGAFEPPLELGAPAELGVNAPLAISSAGEVFVFFAGLEEVAPEGAPLRRVYLRKRAPQGDFAAAVPIGVRKQDVSTESSMAAHVDEVMGTLYLLYRCAFDIREEDASEARDMRLLSSENGGLEFKPSLVNNWKRQTDPKTYCMLVQEKDTTLACWEGDGLVYWSAIRRAIDKVEVPTAPREEKQTLWRSSATAATSGSNVLMVWLERPRDERKGPATLGWGVWLKEGRVPMGDGHGPGAVGSYAPAALARKSGGFTVLY